MENYIRGVIEEIIYDREVGAIIEKFAVNIIKKNLNKK